MNLYLTDEAMVGESVKPDSFETNVVFYRRYLGDKKQYLTLRENRELAWDKIRSVTQESVEWAEKQTVSKEISFKDIPCLKTLKGFDAIIGVIGEYLRATGESITAFEGGVSTITTTTGTVYGDAFLDYLFLKLLRCRKGFPEKTQGEDNTAKLKKYVLQYMRFFVSENYLWKWEITV